MSTKLAEAIKDALANRVKREERDVVQEVEAIRDCIRAKIAGLIAEINNDKIQSKDFKRVQELTFSASNEHAFAAITNFLKNYLADEGFVDIKIEDTNARNSTKKTGQLTFIIPK